MRECHVAQSVIEKEICNVFKYRLWRGYGARKVRTAVSAKKYSSGLTWFLQGVENVQGD